MYVFSLKVHWSVVESFHHTIVTPGIIFFIVLVKASDSTPQKLKKTPRIQLFLCQCNKHSSLNWLDMVSNL